MISQQPQQGAPGGQPPRPGGNGVPMGMPGGMGANPAMGGLPPQMSNPNATREGVTGTTRRGDEIEEGMI